MAVAASTRLPPSGIPVATDAGRSQLHLTLSDHLLPVTLPDGSAQGLPTQNNYLSSGRLGGREAKGAVQYPAQSHATMDTSEVRKFVLGEWRWACERVRVSAHGLRAQEQAHR